MAQVIAFGSIVLLVVVFLLGYEAGHYDGMRCGCAPDQPFWRKWFNVHRAKANHAKSKYE